MHRTLDRMTMDATIYLLVAGFILIGASLFGVGGSIGLFVFLVLVTVVLVAIRSRLPPLGSVFGYDVRRTLVDCWIATALAGTTTVLALGVSPGELQALGGILGLIAMANYFLRPVYYGIYAVVRGQITDDRHTNS